MDKPAAGPASGTTGSGVRLTGLLAEEPSTDTLAEVLDFDPAELDAGERALRLRLIERHAVWLAATQQQAIVDVAGREVTTRGVEEFAEVDVAVAMRLSPASAARRVATARALTGRLRDTLAALESGAIGFWYAVSLVEAVEHLDQPAALAVQATVLEGAERLSLAQFRQTAPRRDRRGASQRR